MVVVDGKGVPLGSTITSASPHEVTLVDGVMAQIKVPRNGPGRPKTRPKRLIAAVLTIVIHLERSSKNDRLI